MTLPNVRKKSTLILGIRQISHIIKISYLKAMIINRQGCLYDYARSWKRSFWNALTEGFKRIEVLC